MAENIKYCDENPNSEICEVKKFFVGVSMPWPGEKLMWDVEENKDLLSPDLMARAKNVKLPLLEVEARSRAEAVEEYKENVPGTKKWKLERGWE